MRKTPTNNAFSLRVAIQRFTLRSILAYSEDVTFWEVAEVHTRAYTKVSGELFTEVLEEVSTEVQKEMSTEVFT